MKRSQPPDDPTAKCSRPSSARSGRRCPLPSTLIGRPHAAPSAPSGRWYLHPSAPSDQPRAPISPPSGRRRPPPSPPSARQCPPRRPPSGRWSPPPSPPSGRRCLSPNAPGKRCAAVRGGAGAGANPSDHGNSSRSDRPSARACEHPSRDPCCQTKACLAAGRRRKNGGAAGGWRANRCSMNGGGGSLVAPSVTPAEPAKSSGRARERTTRHRGWPPARAGQVILSSVNLECKPAHRGTSVDDADVNGATAEDSRAAPVQRLQTDSNGPPPMTWECGNRGHVPRSRQRLERRLH